tara:strand:+ start:1311 stop:1547 length:237 start_codon:yes stop_codon:yes gene_type:complete
MSRKFVLLTASEAEEIVFSEVCETSADSLRWNRDKSETFVKYESGSKPAFLVGKPALSYAQILTELEKEEWQAPPLPE